MRTPTTLILCLFCMNVVAQEKVIRLYEGPAPGSENWKQEEKESRTNLWNTRVVFNVANPTLTIFLPEPSQGGRRGRRHLPRWRLLCAVHRQRGVRCRSLAQRKGLACFVLKYRLDRMQNRRPDQELMAKGATWVKRSHRLSSSPWPTEKAAVGLRAPTRQRFWDRP